MLGRPTPLRAALALAILGMLVLGVGACAEARQNLRGEFVSYRGAWFCGKPGCDEQKMQRSSQAHREGDLTVNHGKVKNGVALVFSAGKAPKTLTASVKDCKGNTADVPGDKVKAPGSHAVSGQSDAWAVIVMPEDYPGLELGKSCKTWTVTTHAEWDKGKWDQAGAVELD
jgi:hypothetical protein